MKYGYILFIAILASICSFSHSTSADNSENTVVIVNDTIKDPFPSDTTVLDNMTIICYYKLGYTEDTLVGDKMLVSTHLCDTIFKK
jgi:hypothetical protein